MYVRILSCNSYQQDALVFGSRGEFGGGERGTGEILELEVQAREE